MSALAVELKQMDINEETAKTKTKEEFQVIETMSHILTILNDVIHPAHDIAVSLFEDKDVNEFVEYCIKNQKLAIDKKLISHICNCYSCGLKGIK
jgi:flagellar biosynthesis component FlhA